MLNFTIAAGGKKGKKKGTTMALTDFLSDDTGAPQGPGSSYVLSNKPVDSWAAEMEDLDISEYLHCFTLPRECVCVGGGLSA